MEIYKVLKPIFDKNKEEREVIYPGEIITFSSKTRANKAVGNGLVEEVEVKNIGK